MSADNELKAWKRYTSVNAVKNGRIYIVDSDEVCSPTPFGFVQGIETYSRASCTPMMPWVGNETKGHGIHIPGCYPLFGCGSHAAMISGSAGIPLRRIFPIIASGTVSPEYSILVDIRLPRIILGFAVGGALSVAGVILQGMFRNPLVEPYTLGISGGAALGAALCIILKLQNIFPP